MTYQIGFIIEQTLGHVAHSQNLQTNLASQDKVQAHWVLPTWEVTGIAGRIPLYRSNWTVRAGLRARAQLAGIQRGTRLDALFFHTQVPAVLSQDWMGRIPSVVSLDATPEQYDSLGDYYDHAAGPDWLETLKWRLNRRCFQQAMQLVTWSQWAKEGLAQGYQVPPQKVHVIPPGVNVSQWTRPGKRDPQPDTIKILFVGGNFERKGGKHLLEAFQALYQRAPFQVADQQVKIELHLVTRDQLPDQPGVTVYNHMEPNSLALKQLYFDSHIFCLPTFGDCLPMVLSEAGASGLPLVSTRVAAIPEIVLEGENGFLTNPGDTQGLYTALQRLITDPGLRQAMGTRATQTVSQRFDARHNAERLVALLMEIADGGK
jgi:glycosyltransferase involved in cell wall biosynthesis